MDRRSAEFKHAVFDAPPSNASATSIVLETTLYKRAWNPSPPLYEAEEGDVVIGRWDDWRSLKPKESSNVHKIGQHFFTAEQG